MISPDASNSPPAGPAGDIVFVPRIINPAKIRRVVIFAADEEIRRADAIIRSEMPWVGTEVMLDPAAVMALRSDEPSAFILDDIALNLIDAETIRKNNREAVIILLSFVKLIQSSPPFVAEKEFPYTRKADLIFAVNKSDCSPARITPSVVRSAEDHLNIARRTEVRRFIVLIVDDEPSWSSQFLPILYSIIGQRAVVKLTRTYEEAVRFIFGVADEHEIGPDYRDHGLGEKVICLITDIFFPRKGKISSDSGTDLIHLVNKHYTRIPIVIASKAKEALTLADKGFILPKGDPGSLETLRSHIRDHTGMGDLVLFDADGKELYRLKDIREILDILMKASGRGPDAMRLRSVLEMYGEKDRFSTWFYMHSLRALGDKLRPQKLRGQEMIAALTGALEQEILDMQRAPLIVDGAKIFSLRQLLAALKSTTPENLEYLSDNDIISSWLDRTGFSDLAEELRPVHGTAENLRESLMKAVEGWIGRCEQRRTEQEEPPTEV